MSDGGRPPGARSGQPDWRGASSSAAPGGLPSGTPGNRGKKAFVLIAGILALAGFAVALVFYLRPMQPPYFLTIAVREYADPQFPVNAWAVQDGDVLLQHFQPDRRKKAYESQTGERIRLELANLREQSDRPVVVHLTALGRTQGGEVYVLPGDANADVPESWLSMREVLRALKDVPAGRQLLILDIMRPLADSSLGLLTDDVAGAVVDLVQEIGNDNLLVLTACGRGQTSTVSLDWGLSIFAYFIDQGLRGEADGAGSEGALDRRITAHELAAFVRERVESWVAQNRGLAQSPQLLGNGRDFPLVHQDNNPAGPVPEAKEWKEGYPGWLTQSWQLRDQWWQDGSFQWAPREFRRLEALVLRAEDRAFAGFEEERLKNEVKDEQARLTKLVEDAAKLPAKRAVSLTMAGAADDVSADLESHVRTSLLVKADEFTAKPAILEKTKLAFVERYKKSAHASIARRLTASAARLPSPTPAQILLLNELLASFPSNDRYVETVFLNRTDELRKRVDDNGWAWPDNKVHQAWRCMQEAEQLIAQVAEEPAVLPLLEEDFARADALRRQGEKSLFRGPPSTWEQADKDLRRAEFQFKDLRARTANYRKASRDFAEALTLLPGYVPYLLTWPEEDPGQDGMWRNAILAGQQMGDLFAEDQGKALFVPNELVVHAKLRYTVASLGRHFSGNCQRFVRRSSDGKPAIYREGEALLTSPRLEALQRKSVWRARRSLAQELLKNTDLTSNARTSLPAPVDAKALRGRRARLAIDLLLLGGVGESGELERQYAKATETGDAEAWSRLGKTLGDLWAGDLFARYLKLENQPVRAYQLCHVLPPLGSSRETTDPTHWSRNPVLLLRRERDQQFRRWLGERYRAEAATYPGNSTGNLFFSSAAEDYLR